MILFVFLSLNLLQEAIGMEFLIDVDRRLILHETYSNSNIYVLDLRANLMDLDYHFTKGYLYYMENYIAKKDGGFLMKRLNIHNPKDRSSQRTDDIIEGGKFTVDWVHDKLYITSLQELSIFTTDLDGKNQTEIISKADVAELFNGKLDLNLSRTLDVDIDPYEELMLMAFVATNGVNVVKSDLNGKNRQIFGESPLDYFVGIEVEINEKNIYIRKGYAIIQVYDYEGNKLTQFSLEGEYLFGFQAFNKALFLLRYVEPRGYISRVTFNSSGAGHQEIFAFDTKLKEMSVWILDARLQKRRRNGKYDCDQSYNCSHNCEFSLDTGDTCFCDDNQVLLTDNRTCTTLGVLCIVPIPSGHRVFNEYPCSEGKCELLPGAYVQHADLVTVTCEPGYYMLQENDFLSTDTTINSCNYDEWFPSLPDCYKPCLPLLSLTVQFTCRQGSLLVSCDKPMWPGTVVEFACKEYHQRTEDTKGNTLTCESSGNWSRPVPYCTPDCGRSNLLSDKVESTILGETFSELGNFPWHTGLYHMRAQKWEAVCGGTLVSPRLVLTAAHCVTNPCVGCKSTAMKPEEVMVALGKRYRSWRTPEASEVKRAIVEVRVHQDYVGSSVNYGADIAVLVMESAVQVTNYVMPACMDFSQAHLKQFQEDTKLQGYVAGWGNTEECSSFGNVCDYVSEELKHTKSTIVFFNDCFNRSQALSEGKYTSSRLTNDKFCAGNGTESVVQKGDSGGGMTFPFGGIHYVYGVVSLKLKLEIGEKTYYSFGAFTNVVNYFKWLKPQFFEM